MMEIIFQTERINFIRPQEELVHDYLQMVNDPEVFKFITDCINNYTIEEEIEWVRKHQNDHVYTMIDRETGNFIGNIEVNIDTYILGICITPNYQDRHYGTEGLQGLINYCFNVLDLEYVALYVFPFNHRAIRCYTNLGFIPDEEHNEKDNGDIYMLLRRQ